MGAFIDDDKARVSFAVIAVLILLCTSGLGAIVARMDMDDGNGLSRDRAIIAEMEERIREIARTVGEDVVKKGLAEGRPLEDIIEDLDSAFAEGFHQEIEVLRGWEIELAKSVMGIDMSGPGTRARLVGEVRWRAVAPQGVIYDRVTGINEAMDGALGIVAHAKDRIEISGDEGGDLSSIVRYMVFKLAMVRAANGEVRASKVITRRDVTAAFELALETFLHGSKEVEGLPGQGPPQGNMDGGVVQKARDPADILLERLGATTINASSLLSQYLVGLLDFYMLWLTDYIGLAEGMERFFEWAGEGITGSEEELGQWWRDFNVAGALERWLFQALCDALHMVLEMADVEDLDVRALDFDEMGSRVGSLIEGAGSEMDNELAGVVRSGEMEDLMEGDHGELVDRLLGALAAPVIQTVRNLVDAARGLVARAWEDLACVDELHGMTVPGSEGLMADLTTRSMDKEDVGKSRFEIAAVSVERRTVDVHGEVRAKGVHHTAPEDRLSKYWDEMMAPGKGRSLEGTMPYETDLRVSIKGSYSIERFAINRRAWATMLGSVEAFNVSWVVPVNISFTVPVFTGVPLEDVDYDPTDTFVGDMVEVLWEFVNRTWEGLQWAAGAMNRLFLGAVEGVRELGRRGLENLGSLSAASFSKTVEGILKALQNKAWNDALNLTWRFLRELLGDDMREMLTFHVDIFGLELTVQVDVFEETLMLSHLAEGRGFELVFKRLADENPPFRPRPVEGYRYTVLGTGFLTMGRFRIEASLDPLTVMFPSIVRVTCESRDRDGRGFRLLFEAPKAYRSDQVKEISISSITGVPITGIPVPGTGLTLDLDAGLRVHHGKGIKRPDKLLTKAVRKAWYRTLKGYSVRELYGELGDPELLEAFVIQLLNNVRNCIGELGSKELPELELFVEGSMSAAGGAASGGFSLSFVIKDPVNVLMELLPWLVDNVRAFLLGMTSPSMPGGFVTLPSVVTENLLVRGFVFSEVGAPGFLGGDRTGKVSLGARLEVNLPALGAMLSLDMGRWMVHTGLVMPGLPSVVASMIPGLSAPKPRCDLWMVELTVMELDNDRAKIGEVYYDTTNRDTEEEFVELWNPTRRRINVSGWTIEDNGGSWRLPDHVSIPPGQRIVIARDRDGMRLKGIPWT